MDLLHYKLFGNTGLPLLILHGLFGSLENWTTQARQLSDKFTVHSLDLRNHGHSPHSSKMGYAEMVDDVIKVMDHLNIESARVMGHSMGGKVAMQLALDHPARVAKLVVVDIAPRLYGRRHDHIFDALARINLDTLESRQIADAQIAEAVSELAVRSFLLKNLQRTTSGFKWKMNLKVLIQEYDAIAAEISSSTPFRGDSLFIKGGNSDYIHADDQTLIQRLFPQARAKVIQNAGHWPHVEKAAVFTKIVRKFLSDKVTGF